MYYVCMYQSSVRPLLTSILRYLEFRFRLLIRTQIKLKKSGSGFLKPCSSRPLEVGLKKVLKINFHGWVVGGWVAGSSGNKAISAFN